MSISVTDDFCKSFRTHKDYQGPTARLIAACYLPEGVSYDDQRVQLIISLCKSGALIPICGTCRGKGVFSIGMTGDVCMDCFGAGIAYPMPKCLGSPHCAELVHSKECPWSEDACQ